MGDFRTREPVCPHSLPASTSFPKPRSSESVSERERLALSPSGCHRLLRWRLLQITAEGQWLRRTKQPVKKHRSQSSRPFYSQLLLQGLEPRALQILGRDLQFPSLLLSLQEMEPKVRVSHNLCCSFLLFLFKYGYSSLNNLPV